MDKKHIFKTILNRDPSREEVSRLFSLSQEDFIKQLFESREKFNQLRSLSGESLKTKVDYSGDEIKDLFGNKDLKVAICLSGHVRNYEKNLININKFLINPLNADVFIHSWDSIGKQIKISNNTVGPVPNETDKELPNFNSYLNNIVKIEVGNNNEFLSDVTLEHKHFLYGMILNKEKSLYGGQAEPKYIYSQLFSVWRSFKLLEKHCEESGASYDIIIKMRADYSPSSGIVKNDFERILEENSIFIPDIPYSNHGHPACCLCKEGIPHEDHLEDVCDVFAYSSFENMSHYMKMYEILEDLNKEQIRLNEIIMSNYDGQVQQKGDFVLVDIWKNRNYILNCFYPERLLRMHLKNYKLTPSRLSGEVIRS